MLVGYTNLLKLDRGDCDFPWGWPCWASPRSQQTPSNRHCVSLGLTVCVSTSAPGQPDFSGVWKLADGDRPQYRDRRAEGNGAARRSVHRRSSVCCEEGAIDGQLHSYMVAGRALRFSGAPRRRFLFFFETNCGNRAHSQHLMRLGADGWTMSVKRTEVKKPGPGTFREKVAEAGTASERGVCQRFRQSPPQG